MSQPTRTEWKIAENAPATFLASLPGVSPLIMQVLWARGFCNTESASEFLSAEPDAADPFALRDMPVAVERIQRAITAGEKIAVYGDYDCDGVTACALLQDTFRALHVDVRIYIPDRVDEGYGLNSGALDKLHAEGVSLVITVDCGARAMSEARHARDLGVDLVVTDHHELEGGALPDACAVINPLRADCPYPFKLLAGVGVAYRLAQALLRSSGHSSPQEIEQALLELVAIGTVADVVPLLGENRGLVRAGLMRINTQPRLGVRYLAQAAGVRLGNVDAQSIGFALGPRLNAAGRMENARDAYELLTTQDETRAHELALHLNERNSRRQQATLEVARHAEQAIFVDGVPTGVPLLFAAGEHYNPGVIGLAAARLMEKFYRPAIVVATHMGEARGSCRSVEGFNITSALDQCRDLLQKHGGHAAAAGFSTSDVQLDELRRRLQEIAGSAQPEGGWTRAIHADAEINLHKLSWEVYNQLQRLEPHGMANPRPVFVTRGVTVLGTRRVGRVHEGSAELGPHLQLRLRDSRSAYWEAIGWRMGERATDLIAGAKIDLAFHLDVNEWNGERRMQLVVQDFRPAAG